MFLVALFLFPRSRSDHEVRKGPEDRDAEPSGTGSSERRPRGRTPPCHLSSHVILLVCLHTWANAHGRLQWPLTFTVTATSTNVRMKPEFAASQCVSRVTWLTSPRPSGCSPAPWLCSPLWRWHPPELWSSEAPPPPDAAPAAGGEGGGTLYYRCLLNNKSLTLCSNSF